MPPAKQTSKKHDGKPKPHGDSAKDMRRAYEHLGRVEILHHYLDKETVKEIGTLSKLAHQQLAAGHMAKAADLLRAAEHLGFGALSSPKAEQGAAPELVDAIKTEFLHKLKKAEQHWSEHKQHDPAMEDLYGNARERAGEAFERGAYRRALELARGADALAHIKELGAKHLGGGGPEQPKLKA